MSEPQSLQTYKSSVDARLHLLSTQLKSKIGLYQGTNMPDVSEIVSRFFNSAEVKEFQTNAEKLRNLLNDPEKIIADEYIKLSVTQKMMTDIDEYGKLKLFKNKIKYLKQNPPRPSSRSRSYDQVVKGDIKIVEIKNNSEYSHKIKFNKIGKILQYQVFDPKGIAQLTHLPIYPSNIEQERPNEFRQAKKYAEDNPDKVVTVDYQINEDRDVVLKTGKEWVLYFNSVPGFTPTTVMEIGYKKYIFVIKKAEINKNDKVVFYISTKEIQLDNKSDKMKKLKKIPKGEYKNVRFDIDYGNSSVCLQNNVNKYECSCPSGYYITQMGWYEDDWIIFSCTEWCDSGYHNSAGFCWEDCGSGCSDTLGCCNRWGGWLNTLIETCHNPECVSSYAEHVYNY